MEVHRELGHGFLEAVYQEALALEFGICRIPFTRETPLVIHYKRQPLNCPYKADFICHGEIIVELKAMEALAKKEQAQVINYLHATKFKRALLINFGAESLQYEPRLPGGGQGLVV